MKVLKNFTLFIVEDDQTTLSILEDYFKPFFKKIYLARDGVEAFKSYQKNKPDIIIMDIGIPKIDGLELIEKIRALNKEQKVLILTAREDVLTLKKIINLNISKILFKPLSSLKLLSDSIIEIAQNIQNEVDANNLKLLKAKKEKEEFLLAVIKQISHHWKQPLSIISTLSSSCSFQKEMNIPTSIEDDIESAKLITKKTQELSNILDAIDNINYENISIEEIEKLIQISNPIIEPKNPN